MSTLLQLGNAPIEVRGDKETMIYAQDQNDQLDRQTTAANTRIPYASTLLQLQGGPERFTYGMDLTEDEESMAGVNTMEASLEEIPTNWEFVHISNPSEEGDELVKIEDRNVPLNYHL